MPKVTQVIGRGTGWGLHTSHDRAVDHGNFHNIMVPAIPFKLHVALFTPWLVVFGGEALGDD